MTTIYLIRHAEAEGNIFRRAHGWYDSSVTRNGLRQIEALKKRFESVPVDADDASDLIRIKTQNITLKHLPGGKDPSVYDKRFHKTIFSLFVKEVPASLSV